MSAALYNRYRPRTFAEVVGQEHVTGALIAALTSGKTHHAYLFSGPRGCGKTSSARILAASLNCVDGPTPTPCGECEQCVAIRAGSSLDVVEIDAASHGGVDDARDLRERALYVPASGRYRIFVIDEAHQVSRDGFNALLKIVEEPPPYLVFIFATTEPDKVLATIRSRTFSYQFRLVPPGILREHLARICEAEGAEIAPEVLPLVVRAGGGSVRDSLSVLDQLIAGGVSTYERAAALLGVTDVVLLDDAIDALSARDGAGLFGLVERVVSAGHDPRAFAKDMLERLRDLVLLQAVPEAAERGLVEGVPLDQLQRMRQQAQSLGAAELSRAADIVHAGLIEMRGTTSPRLLLELVCARLLLPAADGSAASLLARVDAVERRLVLGAASAAGPRTASAGLPPGPDVARAPGLVHEASTTAAPTSVTASATPASVSTPTGRASGSTRAPATASSAGSGAAPTAPARETSPDPAPEVSAPATSTADGRTVVLPPDAAPVTITIPAEPVSAPASAGGPGTLDVTAMREAWPLVLDAVKARRQVPFVMLSHHAAVVAVDGDKLTVGMPAPMARQFQTSPGVEILMEALTEVVSGTWRVLITPVESVSGGGDATTGFAVGDGPGEPEPAAPPAQTVAEASAPEQPSDDSPALPAQVVDPIDLVRAEFGATVIDEFDAAP